MWHGIEFGYIKSLGCPKERIFHRFLGLFRVLPTTQIPMIRDACFVVSFWRNDLGEDWENGARGNPDFWSRADNFVALKCGKLLDCMSTSGRHI